MSKKKVLPRRFQHFTLKQLFRKRFGLAHFSPPSSPPFLQPAINDRYLPTYLLVSNYLFLIPSRRSQKFLLLLGDSCKVLSFPLCPDCFCLLCLQSICLSIDSESYLLPLLGNAKREVYIYPRDPRSMRPSPLPLLFKRKRPL